MSGAVSFSDLFDPTGPGRQELDDLTKTIGSLNRSVKLLSKNLESDGQRIATGLAAIKDQTAGLREQATTLSQAAQAEGTSLRALSVQMGELAKQQQQLQQAEAGATKAKELAQEATRGYNAELKKQRDALREAYAANDTQAIVKAAKEIQKLKTQTSELDRALRGANSSYTAAAGSFRAMENEARSLDVQLKALGNGMEADSAEARQMKARLAEVNQAMISFTRDVNQGYKNVGRYAESIIEAVGALEKQKAVLLANAQALNTQARAAGLGAEQQNKLQSEIKQTEAELGKVNGQLRTYGVGVQQSGGLTASLGESVGGLAQSFAGAYYGIQGVATVLQQVFEANLKYSDSVVDVAKTTGLTVAQTNDLAESLKKLDTRTSLQGLLAIAQVGGQLGVAGADIESFTKAINVSVQALGNDFSGDAEQIATALGKINTVFGKQLGNELSENLLHIGSALNQLGAVGAATAPQLADVALRTGAVAANAGLGLDKVLSYAAVLQEVGFSAEQSGTSLNRLFSTLTTRTEAAFNVAKLGNANLTLKEFRRLVNTDFEGAIQAFLKGLNAGGTTTIKFNELLKTLKLQSGEAKAAITSLAKNLDLYTERQAVASAELKSGTSVSAEAALVNNTLAGSWDKLKNDVGNFFTSGVASQSIKWFVDVFREGNAILFSDVLGGIGRGIASLAEKTGLTTKVQEDYTVKIVAGTQALLGQAAAQQTLLDSYKKLTGTASRSAAQELELAQTRAKLAKQFGTEDAGAIQARIDRDKALAEGRKKGLEADLRYYDDAIGKTQIKAAQLQDAASKAQAAFSRFGLSAEGQKNVQEAAGSNGLMNALNGNSFPKEQLAAAKELNAAEGALATTTADVTEKQRKRAVTAAALAKLSHQQSDADKAAAAAALAAAAAKDKDTNSLKKKTKATADSVKEEAALAKQRLEERLSDLTRQSENPSNSEAVRAEALRKAAQVRIQIAANERDEMIHEAALKFKNQMGGEQALGVATIRAREAFSAKALGIDRETNKALLALHNALLDQLGEVDKLVIGAELTALETVSANRDLSYEERHQADADAAARHIELIAIEADKEIRAAEGNAKKILAIKRKQANDTEAVLKGEKSFDSEKTIDAQEASYGRIGAALEGLHNKGLVSERNYQRQLLKLENDKEREAIAALEREYGQTADVVARKIALDKKENKEARDEAKQTARLKGELINEGLDHVRNFSDAYFTIQANANQAALSDLQHNKEVELAVAGDNLELKAQTEEKYRKLELAAKRKQAEQDKRQAEFNVVINTAQAVTSVLSTGGGTRYLDFGISAAVLSAFVIAQGLAQLAVIESRPLPAYFKGRRTGPAELAVVAEKGPELIGQESTGFRVVAHQAVTRLSAGDRVFTAPETRDVMRDHELIAGRLVARRQEQDTERQTASLRNANGRAEALAAAEARVQQQRAHLDTERIVQALVERPVYALEEDGLYRYSRKQDSLTKRRAERYMKDRKDS